MSSEMHFGTVPLAELKAKGLTRHADPLRPVILVVDDEAVIADTLAAILSHQGFTALVAYDGRRALEIARAISPNLLLTDVVMPGMNGVDLAFAIRQSAPRCQILLFSGQAATVDLLAEAGEAGRDFIILSKPLHPTELLARISQSLDAPRSRGAGALQTEDLAASLGALSPSYLGATPPSYLS
jgi:DNA-binding response OmpR family regulator